MAGERVITLRFKEENPTDMELYRSLEKEKKELGVSTPVYVKDILQHHFENVQKEQFNVDINKYLEQVRDMIHEELSFLNDAIMEVMCRMSEFPFDNTRRAVCESVFVKKEEILPEYSEELPEGMDSILEQFI